MSQEVQNPKKELNEIARDLIIERCLIHGLPHIVDGKKSLWIRLFWSILLIFSFIFYFYFLFLISWKFWITPDIFLNFGTRQMSELPFPAITICSPTLSNYQNAYYDQFYETSVNISTDFDTFVANAQWCFPKAAVKALNLSNKPFNGDILKIMRNSQLKLEDSMSNCSYRTSPVDCKKLFTRVLTQFGYCFTYNMQDHHAIFNEEISKDFDDYGRFNRPQQILWTLDGGYNTEQANVFPRRATVLEELTINMRIINEDIFNYFQFCTNLYIGFNIFLHLPNELFSIEKPYESVFRNIDQVFTISAKSYRVSKEVRSYPANVRKCYFEDEKKLRFFKSYTENMCRLECLTNFTLSNCGCVRFSMPRDDKTKICVNYSEVKCMTDSENAWEKSSTCGCLKSCHNVKYFVNFDKVIGLNSAVDDQGGYFNVSDNDYKSRIFFKIFHHEVEEDLTVCAYDSSSYITSIGGLTTLFIGCSMVSLLEFVFFTQARRHQTRVENATSGSILDEFVKTSSIEGAKCFHSSESKATKVFWIFIFFLSFCGLGFYISEIYSRCQLKPSIAIEISQISMQEIPFPANTICMPLYSVNVSLYQFLRYPDMNLTAAQQTYMAANLQACSPRIASKFSHHFPLSDSKKIIPSISSKSNFLRIKCFYELTETLCSKMFNYVLTDYGYCFTFNLEGFSTLFNTKVISDDFKCYKRTNIAKNYNVYHPDHSMSIDNQTEIHWTLEKGYQKNTDYVTPVRAISKNKIIFYFDSYPAAYLCPDLGFQYTSIIHMPNEIPTPFHKPIHTNYGYVFKLSAKYYVTDESLKPFSPSQRSCYFEGEKRLKFFKTYTKAHCEFECLANFTLNHCGCVKFSMPRENTTEICGMDQTPCYVEAMRIWSSKDENRCNCLQPCNYIEYVKEDSFKTSGSSVYIIGVNNYFAEKHTKSSSYGLENGLADFGGMLGVFFGASVISFIEIFYFFFIVLIRRKFNIREEISGSSNILDQIAKESTIHGFQFIFKRSVHIFLRFFWIITLMLTLTFGLFYARGNYKKLAINPETAIQKKHKPVEDVPFPAITICSPLVSKQNLSTSIFNYASKIHENITTLKTMNDEEFSNLIANIYCLSPNLLWQYLYPRYKFNPNISDAWNYRSNLDLSATVNKSQFEIDEFFLKCEISEVEFDCKKFIRRILTIQGICYAFNMQSFHTIFNKEISRNFDSYGRYEEEEESQWSLDQEFKVKNPVSPMRASTSYEISFYFKLPKNLIANYMFDKIMFYINPPSDLLTQRMNENLRRFKPENRGCYFQDERKLQFFKTYTKTNCEFECIANYTLQMCGCVSFLQLYNDSTKICISAKESKCFMEVLTFFPPLNDSSAPCGCLTTCNKIEYTYEMTNIDDKYFYNFSHLVRSHGISKLSMKFAGIQKEEKVFGSYGFLNFITDVGGLLGLFLGCSMISFFELIYYPLKFIVDNIGKKRQIMPEDSKQLENSKKDQNPGISNEETENPIELIQRLDGRKLKRKLEELSPEKEEFEVQNQRSNLDSSLSIEEIEHRRFLSILAEFEKELEEQEEKEKEEEKEEKTSENSTIKVT